MPFVKGRQKTGGRKKGVPNKNRLRLLEDHIRLHNIDLPKMIFDELNKLSDPQSKIKFLIDIYRYIDVQATSRPVEIDAEESMDELSDEQILELALVKKSNE